MVSWLWKKNGKEEEEVDEDELKKKGFNPEGLEIEEMKEDELLKNFDKDYEGFICPPYQEALDIIASYKYNHIHQDFFPTTTNIDMNSHIKMVEKFAEIQLK
jgi:hypothetical protein